MQKSNFTHLLLSFLLFYLTITSSQPCASPQDCPTSSPVCGTNNNCEPCSNNLECSNFAPNLECSAGSCVQSPSCTQNSECNTYDSLAACSNGYCAPCSSPSDCSGHGVNYVCSATGVCQPETCSSSTDCSNPLYAFCESGHCSGCTSDSDCSNSGNSYQCSGGVCSVVSCGSVSSCTNDKYGACTNGICVPCTQNTDCSTHGVNYVCNTQNGECQAETCTSNNNCLNDNYAACNTTTETCTTCQQDSDCSLHGANYICSSGTCIGQSCTSTSDCISDSYAACTSSFCAACNNNEDCLTHGPKYHCSSGTCVSIACTNNTNCTLNDLASCNSGFCSPCNSSLQCETHSPYVNCELGICKTTSCTTNSDCTMNSLAACTSGFCSPCTKNSECSLFGNAFWCKDSTCQTETCTKNDDCLSDAFALCSEGICAPCTNDTDCFSQAPKFHCDGGTCKSIPCHSDAECESYYNLPLCINSACTPCTTSQSCESHLPNITCQDGSCIPKACSSSSDCPNLLPVCVEEGVCTGCSSDSQCSSRSPDVACINSECMPIPCQTSQQCSMTSLALCSNGECAPCQQDEDCSFQVPNIECANGNCQPICTSSSQCPITSAPRCYNGNCTACISGDDCPQGMVCNSYTGGCQTPCSDPSGCTYMTPICHVDSGTCGPCSTFSDCTPFKPKGACDTSTGQCYTLCSDNSGCNINLPHCGDTGCVTCQSDDDCSLYPNTVCDTIGGGCRQPCDSNTTCHSNLNYPVCLDGLCQPCTMNYHCLSFAANEESCNSGTCGPTPPNPLSLSIMGAPYYSVNHWADNYINAELGAQFSLQYATVTWSFINGVIQPGWFDPRSPLVLTIPACSLANPGMYGFRVQVDYSNPVRTSYQEVVLIVADVGYFYPFFNGNRTQAKGVDWKLQAETVYSGECPIVDNPSYQWSCSGDKFCDNWHSTQALQYIPASAIQSEKVIFTVMDTIGHNSEAVSGFIEFVNYPPDVQNIEITCLQGCTKFSTQQESLFMIVGNIELLTNPSIQISPNSINYYNWEPPLLIIPPNPSLMLSPGSFVLTLTCSTPSFYNSWIMPINLPPTGGTFTVTSNGPAGQPGVPLTTVYTLTASGWIDPSSTNALNYEFWYALQAEGPFFPLTSRVLFSTFTTTLLGGNQPGNIEVRLDIIDYLGVFTTVYQNISMGAFDSTPSNFITVVGQKLTGLSGYAVSENLATLSSLINAMNIFYPSQRYFSNSEITLLSQANQNIINALSNQYIIGKTSSEKDSITKLLAAASQSENLNNLETYYTIIQTIKSALNVMNNQSNLTTVQAESLATALDNTVTYLEYYDCECSSQLSKSMVEILTDWMSAITESIAINQEIGQPPNLMQFENFNLFVAATTPCDINSLKVQIPNTPVVSFMMDTQGLDCTQRITLQLYAIKNPIFYVCPKPNIEEEEEEEEGGFWSQSEEEEASSNGQGRRNLQAANNALCMTFQSPNTQTSNRLKNIETNVEGGVCPSECNNYGSSCICSSYLVFDPANVILGLLSPPQVNYEAPAQPPGPTLLILYKNGLFWAFIAVTVWVLLLEKTGLKAAFNIYLAKEPKDEFNALRTSFQISHYILAAYNGRNVIYCTLLAYCRLMMLLAYVAVFDYITFQPNKVASKLAYVFYHEILYLGIPTYLAIWYGLTIATAPNHRTYSKRPKRLIWIIFFSISGIIIGCVVSEKMLDSSWGYHWINLVLAMSMDVLVFPLLGFCLVLVAKELYYSKLLKTPRMKAMLGTIAGFDVIKIYDELNHYKKRMREMPKIDTKENAKASKIGDQSLLNFDNIMKNIHINISEKDASSMIEETKGNALSEAPTSLHTTHSIFFKKDILTHKRNEALARKTRSIKFLPTQILHTQKSIDKSEYDSTFKF